LGGGIDLSPTKEKKRRKRHGGEEKKKTVRKRTSVGLADDENHRSGILSRSLRLWKMAPYTSMSKQHESSLRNGEYQVGSGSQKRGGSTWGWCGGFFSGGTNGGLHAQRQKNSRGDGKNSKKGRLLWETDKERGGGVATLSVYLWKRQGSGFYNDVTLKGAYQRVKERDRFQYSRLVKRENSRATVQQGAANGGRKNGRGLRTEFEKRKGFGEGEGKKKGGNLVS